MLTNIIDNNQLGAGALTLHAKLRKEYATILGVDEEQHKERLDELVMWSELPNAYFQRDTFSLMVYALLIGNQHRNGYIDQTVADKVPVVEEEFALTRQRIVNEMLSEIKENGVWDFLKHRCADINDDIFLFITGRADVTLNLEDPKVVQAYFTLKDWWDNGIVFDADYKTRLIEEYKQLKDRITKAKKYVGDLSEPAKIYEGNRLLAQQVLAMEQYFDILAVRINHECD